MTGLNIDQHILDLSRQVERLSGAVDAVRQQQTAQMELSKDLSVRMGLVEKSCTLFTIQNKATLGGLLVVAAALGGTADNIAKFILKVLS